MTWWNTWSLASGLRQAGWTVPRAMEIAGLLAVYSLFAWWWRFGIENEDAALVVLCIGALGAGVGGMLDTIRAARLNGVLPWRATTLFIASQATFIFIGLECLGHVTAIQGDTLLAAAFVACFLLVVLPIDVLWLRVTGKTPFLLDLLLCGVVGLLFSEAVDYLRFGEAHGSWERIITDPFVIVVSMSVGAYGMWHCDIYEIPRIWGLVAAAVISYFGPRSPF